MLPHAWRLIRRSVYGVVAIVLVAVSDRTGQSQQEAPIVPKLWTAALGEVREVLRESDPNADIQAIRPKLQGRASHLGDPKGVDELVQLYDSAERSLEQISNENERQAVEWLTAAVVAQHADVDGKAGLKAVVANERVRIRDVILVGIDLRHDEVAQKSLLELALQKRPGPDKAWRQDREGMALQLLRGYEGKAVQPELEAALRQAIANETAKSESQLRITNLRACLSSLAFASEIPDEEDRAQYRRFESKLWRAITLAPKNFRHSSGTAAAAAAILKPQLQVGDDTFLLRIFQDDDSTLTETFVAVQLVGRIPSAVLPALRDIADGKFKKSDYARQAIELLEKGQNGERERELP